MHIIYQENFKRKEWSNEGSNTIIQKPMNHDKKALNSLEDAESPTDPNQRIQLQRKQFFHIVKLSENYYLQQ